MVDYEKNNRFYSERKLEDIKPHQFIFQKFCKSIHFKSLLEMIIWGVLAITFQYYITGYITGVSDFFVSLNKYPENIKAYYEIEAANAKG
jgi:hypothetical protein